MELPHHKVICHVDMDAFYCQVEAKRDPDRLGGRPLVIVQYNPLGDTRTYTPDSNRILPSSPNSIIAVSYEARPFGIKRNMRGDEALALYPDLCIVQVPTAHNKADLTLYREAGKEVLSILAEHAGACERASIDEVYLDLTAAAGEQLARLGAPPFAPPPDAGRLSVAEQGEGSGNETATRAWFARPATAWLPGEALLAAGCHVAAAARAAVRARTGYTCSAGVAHSKLLAKLASGLRKPDACSLIPAEGVPPLMALLPLPRLRALGGKYGAVLGSSLGIATAGELAAVPRGTLEAVVGERDAAWLAGLARGVDGEEVTHRRLPKSLSCGKTFRGKKHALKDAQAIRHWLGELGKELEERLGVDRGENQRLPTLLTVSWTRDAPGVLRPAAEQQPASTPSVSRSCVLRRAEAGSIADDAAQLFRRWAAEQPSGWSIGSLFVEASKFVTAQGPAAAITRFFKPGSTQGAKGPASRDPGPRSGGGETSGASPQVDQLSGVASTTPPGPDLAAPPAPGPTSTLLSKAELRKRGAAATPRGPDGSQEAFISELPPALQREVRAQLRADAMAARLGDKRATPGAGPAAPARRKGAGKKARPTGPTLDQFLGATKASKEPQAPRGSSSSS